ALVHIQGLEQGVEVAAVLDEAIRAGATVGELVGDAHTAQVGGEAPASWLHERQHAAPKVRRGGIALEHHDAVALSPLPPRRHAPSLLPGRHLAAGDPPPLLLVRKCRLVIHRLGHRHAHEALLLGWRGRARREHEALRGTSVFACRYLAPRLPKRSIAHGSGWHGERWQSRSTLV